MDLKNAKWIGSPYKSINTWNLKKYSITGAFEGKKTPVSLLFAARDFDNGLEIEFNNTLVSLFERSDLAWEGHSLERHGEKRRLIKAFDIDVAESTFFEIQVEGTGFSMKYNDACIAYKEEILPESNRNTEPVKSRLMMVGFEAKDRHIIKEFTVRDDEEVLFDLSHENAGLLFEKEKQSYYIKPGAVLTDPVPAVMLGKRIELTNLSLIKKAILRTTARGFYECYLNGVKAGASYYAPGFTDYRLHIDYQEEDITSLLKASGENPFFSAIVTHGYYSGFCGYSGAEIYGRENSFLGEIEIEYTDGHREVVSTDEDFYYTDCAPVRFADYLDGEYYDANLEGAFLGEGNWIKCGVKEAPGTPVPTNGSFSAVKTPKFILSRQDYEPAKVREERLPIGMVCVPQGHYVYDFGQNLVGTIKLSFKAEKGRAFRIRYGEMAYKDGEIYIQNIRTAANTDIYICKGHEDVYVPSFTSHGFRYVEITAVGSEMVSPDEVAEIKALVINNLVRKTGDFECSDELLNQLQKNIQWGQKGNYLLIPTDCPQRNERMGWTGDAQVFASTAAFNMDVLEFTKKWLRDLREATLMYNRENAIPDTAPLGGDNRPGPCGGWSDAAVIVPCELYEEYADESILAENYEMMKGWVEYQSRPDREQDGIQLEKRRGDHLAYDTSTSFELCATAYAARSAEYLSKAAAVLGKKEDALKYKERHDMIKRAFMNKWFGADGDLNVHSQTSYALTIDFGLCDNPVPGPMAEGFIKAVKAADDHLSVGFLGISHLLPALSKIGRDDLAAKLLFTKTEPGWLYSVLNGATTIWERWNSYIAETGTFGDVNMNSFNHYAYGSVGSWIYENILGIKRLAPGYAQYEIKPHALGGLTWAKGYHDTIRGRISVNWKIDEKGNMIINNDKES